MEKLEFKIEIESSKDIVWEIMWNKEYFKEWAGIIDAGTYMAGELAEGNIIEFISSESGYGVSSKVEKLVPNEYIEFWHMSDTKERGTKERAQEWTGGIESYSLTSSGKITILTVKTDIPEEIVLTFSEVLPEALKRIKQLCEEKNKKN